MPRKPRKLEASPDSCDTDLLTEPILKILRRHKVEKDWLEPLAVHSLIVAAWGGLPDGRRVDELTVRTRRRNNRRRYEKADPDKRKERVELLKRRRPILKWVRAYRSQERLMAGVIARLSAQNPPKFWKVLNVVSDYVHKRYRSPEFVTALRLWMETAGRPETLDRPREDLAAAITRNEGLPVTGKVVEHALRKGRTAGILRSRPFPPKRGKFPG